MESFVPTEYDNVYMDYEGFIYVCTTNASEADIKSGKTDVVRRLNLMGNDILIRNGNQNIIGDVEWDNAGGYNGPSMITDITALDNDTYGCLTESGADYSPMMIREICYMPSEETEISMDVSDSLWQLTTWGMTL